MDSANQMVEQNLGLAYYLANAPIPGIELEDRKQIAVVGLIKASREWDQFRTFSTFAHKCIADELATARKAATADKRVPEFGFAPLNESIADRRRDPLDASAVKEFLVMLIEKLEPNERAVLSLRLNGWRHCQIAERLGITLKNSLVTHVRAVKHCRELIDLDSLCFN